MDLPVSSFAFRSSLLKAKSVDLVVANDASFFTVEIICIFIVATLITEMLFDQFLIVLLCNGLNIADHKA